jgi:hypothetical protein
MPEPARATEIGPLLLDAYGLTRREVEVTQLILRGTATGRGCHSTVDLTTDGSTAPQGGVRQNWRQ